MSEPIQHTLKVFNTAEKLLIKFREDKIVNRLFSYGQQTLLRGGAQRVVQYLEMADADPTSKLRLRIEVFVIGDEP